MDKKQSDNATSYPTEECSKKRGRARLYVEDYSTVQNQLKKQIKLRNDVYSKWNIAKDIWAKEKCIHEADSNNSDFANALLHWYENLRHLMPESIPNKE